MSTLKPTDPRGVIRSYLLITSLFTLSASVIWGVNTLFLLDAGLDIFQVFLANAAFTASMVVFEVPTGVVADTLGRRTSFLLSEAVLLVGTLAYVGAAELGGGVGWFAATGVILALGYTFYSGAVESWVVDALRATGHQGDLDRVFARGSMVSGAAMVVGTIGGGLLGTADLSAPYLVRSALVVGAFAVGFARMHEIGFAGRPLRWSTVLGEMTSVGRAGVTYGWRRPSVRLLIMISFVQWGFFAWAWYAWQPYFLGLLGHDLVWVSGLIAALFALASIAGNALVGRLTRPGRRRTTILVAMASAFTVAAVGVGTIRLFWVAVPLFLLGAVAMGVQGPVKQAYLHQVIPSQQRATIVSFQSMVAGLGSSGGEAGLGYLSRVRSIGDGFLIGGLSTALVLPLLLRLRHLHEPADVVRREVSGTGAGGVVHAPAVD